MIRKIISLLLILTLTSFCVGLSGDRASSAPGGGDVDPTGLDLQTRVSVPESGRDYDVVKLSERERHIAELKALRWIESFLIKDLLRRISF
jgi:hypothetical protein